jgi:hypothetical protein
MTHSTRRASALASAAFIACLGLSSAPALASHVGESLTLDQQLVGASDQLLSAVAQWEKMPASVREARIAQLTAMAARRQQLLIQLLEKNPKVAAARMMPKSLRDRLPAQVAALVEREVSEQGSVFASVADDIEQGVSRTEFKFQPSSGGMPLKLYLADGSDEQELLKWAGKKLSLNAMRIGERLALLDQTQARLMAADGTTSATGSVVTSATTVQGVQKTLSILVNFNDKALTCTAADIGNRLFGSSGATVNNNYRESSRGLVSFTGQVVGPFNINYSSTGSCDYGGWGAAAEAAARAAGIDPSQFARVNYVTPSNGTCGWGGLAYMPGRQSWVQSCGSTGLFSHELGHNLSLNHAATPTAEYGDSSDPMGSARLVGHNGANRAMAGWMPSGTVVDAGAAGTYSLTTVSNTASVGAPQVLRLYKADTREYYYVSLRQAIGLDAALATTFVGTLSVHRASGTLPAKTYLMQVLAAGQTFVDGANGITIANQGAANGVATVGVALTGTAAICTRALPTVAVSPASQTASPGAARSFTVTVTNRNSAACGSSTFAMTQALPSGFSASFSASSLALGAGASGSVTWTAASAAASPDATYMLDATAADSASGVSRTTAHASYIVYRDSTAPTLAITSPSATLAAATFSLRTNLAIAANASDPSGIQAVEFYGSGVLLARDTAAPYSANWNLRKAGKGVHTIKVRAIDNAGNAAEQTLTISVN